METTGTLPVSLLRDELWIYCNGLEKLTDWRLHYARSLHYPDICKSTYAPIKETRGIFPGWLHLQ